MEAGKMRHRIVIEQSARAADDMGQAIETWTTYATLWANVEPLRGRELFAAQAANSEATIKITMRYYSGVKAKWRVKHGTAVYEIMEMINPGMRDEAMQLLCKQLPQVDS